MDAGYQEPNPNQRTGQHVRGRRADPDPLTSQNRENAN